MSDSDLYTGVQPTDAGVFGNEAEPKEQKEEREQQLVEATKLLPKIEVITEVIKGFRLELDSMADMRKHLGSKPSKAELEVEFQVRDRCDDFLSRLEADISNRVANFKEQSK